MLLAFMFLLSPLCGGDALFAKNGVNIIVTYAIASSIVFTKTAGKRNTLQGIEVCNSFIFFDNRFTTRFIILKVGITKSSLGILKVGYF
jgi:hypothetical protein